MHYLLQGQQRYAEVMHRSGGKILVCAAQPTVDPIPTIVVEGPAQVVAGGQGALATVTDHSEGGELGHVWGAIVRVGKHTQVGVLRQHSLVGEIHLRVVQCIELGGKLGDSVVDEHNLI